MGRARSVSVRAAAATGFLLLFAILVPGQGLAVDSTGTTLRADLDGKPLDLVQVGRYYCEDFDYPVIHCFTRPAALEATVSAKLSGMTADSTTSVNYVVVYEYTSYQGAYMYMSQDYSILATIGWNDRISSLRVLDSSGGVFWTDWLYSGTPWSFCCTNWFSSLGSFDNTFSSVYQN
jgi:hypothetical protein